MSSIIICVHLAYSEGEEAISHFYILKDKLLKPQSDGIKKEQQWTTLCVFKFVFRLPHVNYTYM